MYRNLTAVCSSRALELALNNEASEREREREREGKPIWESEAERVS